MTKTVSDEIRERIRAAAQAATHPFTTKTVLVTGAAKRIGRGIALRLAKRGYKVAIHYHTSEAEARRTAEECGGAKLFRANLENIAEIRRLFADIGERLGTLYGLVNNAARFTR